MELDNLEQITADAIAKGLTFYENQHPDLPLTNVVQAFSMMELGRPHRTHPYRLQERFLEFGKQSGFKDSIYEKYVAVSVGITNRAIQGVTVFMSAEPFSDLNRDTVRMVIWKAGKRDYRIARLEDQHVQEILKEANLTIPKPTPMPPPPVLSPLEPDPISVKVEKYFRDVAGNIGIGRGSWWIILLLYAAVAGLFLLFLYIWFGRRSRH
jgi:hypothetical protein